MVLAETMSMRIGQFHKDADAVLDFIQDKLEEYVEDNNIAGGDVEQGVRR